MKPTAKDEKKPNWPVTIMAALGVVFGDIGTSPIYAFKQCLSEDASPNDVLGIVSLILWSLIILVTAKYVLLMLRLDNQGEGGILALLTKVFPKLRQKRSHRLAAVMMTIGLLGAALLYGDGVITPAISVLSAIEGVAVYSPQLDHWVVPTTVTILLGLFAIQNKGSGSVGKIFGPIMLLWFLSLAIFGVIHVIQSPGILLAINPLAGLQFVCSDLGKAMVILGSVVLAVTGCEALYADLGHFGRLPIQLGWNLLVLPALGLNYLGQGALVLNSPPSAHDPFFLLFPRPLLLPMVVLSAMATIIASQALISGIFSLTMQAGQIGYLPRLRVQHTNAVAEGQVYIPLANALLAVACICVVIGFGSSTRLGAAYGVAVTLTMLTTTALFSLACRKLWRWPLWLCVLVCGAFAAIELAFFASNALKIAHGGWLPLCLGGLIFFLMTTWNKGRAIVLHETERTGSLEEFVKNLHTSKSDQKILRPHAPGTAVYLTASKNLTPRALVQNLKHNHVLHQRIVILTIITDDIPRCPGDARLEIKPLSKDIYHLIFHYGYMEIATMDKIIACAGAHDFQIDLEDTSFFLGSPTAVPSKHRGLNPLRKAAFVFMSRNAQWVAQSLGMPCDRTIEIRWEAQI